MLNWILQGLGLLGEPMCATLNVDPAAPACTAGWQLIFPTGALLAARRPRIRLRLLLFAATDPRHAYTYRVASVVGLWLTELHDVRDLFIQGCRAKGDYLVVGLNTDASIRGTPAAVFLPS